MFAFWTFIIVWLFGDKCRSLVRWGWEWEGMGINFGNGMGMGMLQAIPAHLYCTVNTCRRCIAADARTAHGRRGTGSGNDSRPTRLARWTPSWTRSPSAVPIHRAPYTHYGRRRGLVVSGVRRITHLGPGWYCDGLLINRLAKIRCWVC